MESAGISLHKPHSIRGYAEITLSTPSLIKPGVNDLTCELGEWEQWNTIIQLEII
jgi:hypothetical protein